MKNSHSQAFLHRVVQFLKDISLEGWKSPFYQFLLFATATILSVGFVGYYFGTFDQASHIPFLKKLADPGLYSKDSFFDLQSTHYSYFWLLLLPFYKLGILEITLFILYILSVFFTFVGVWRLSKLLFNDALTSFLSVTVFIIPHFAFAAFALLEFSFVNRVFALPFLLLAIELYVNRRYVLAFILLGLVFNIHIISVNFVMAMVVFDSLVRIRQIGVRNVFMHFFVFLLCALPVLAWKFSNPANEPLIDARWLSIISNSFLANLFYLFATPGIAIASIGGIACLAGYFILVKQVPSDKNPIITNFMIAAALVIVVEVITALFLPIVIIIQSQIIRIGVFIMLFYYLYFIRYTTLLLQRNGEGRFLFLASILHIAIWPILPAFILFIEKYFNTLARVILFVFVLIISFFTLLLAFKVEVWKPGIHIFTINSPYYHAQLWAKNNTPKEVLFITPPAYWWWYNVEWRVGSERGTVVILSDILEAAFSPSYTKKWESRFEDVAPGALAQFKGDALKNREMATKAYKSLSTEDVIRIGKKYQASYFVTDKSKSYDLSKVYENEEYIIYKL